MITLQMSPSLEAALPSGTTPSGTTPSGTPDFAFLERAADEALRMAGEPSPGGLTILISDDLQLHELNRQYLGIDAPTDVLSFPVDETDPDTGERYLGDVILSYPRAATQAAAAGHSLEDELLLLVVHGVLHLLGYDHAAPHEKARMWEIQARILASLGSNASPPAEYAE
jgi:probable rRNA maturation factor